MPISWCLQTNSSVIWYLLPCRSAQLVARRSAWGSVGSMGLGDVSLVMTDRPSHTSQKFGFSVVGGQKVNVYKAPKIPVSLL